jgi:hypothetical protein
MATPGGYRRPHARIAALATLGALVAGLAAEAVFGGGWLLPLDTQQVLDGVGVLDHCATAHVYSHCDAHGFGATNPFPAAQYLIGLGLKHAGASYWQAAHWLIGLNRLAALGVLLLSMLAGRHIAGTPGMLVMALVAITGPLLWYSQMGFAESLAAFSILWMAVALLKQRWWMVAVAALLAAVTKETAPFFLVPLAAAIVLSERRPLAAGLLPVVTGAAVGVLVNVLFNVWRYGTLYNEYYSEPARITPGVGLKAQFFAGQLVAPNAGLLWFWPVAAVVMTVAVVAALRAPPHGDRRPVLLWLVTFAGLVGIFASYHSPYGWNAWGPRYLVPWIPALCVAALAVADPGRLRHAASTLGRTRVWLGATLVTIALALPQLGVFMSSKLPFHLFDDARPPCYYVAPTVLEAYEHPNYYRCTTHLSWAAKPILLHGMRGLRSAEGVGLSVLLALAAGGLLFAAGRETEVGRRPA